MKMNSVMAIFLVFLFNLYAAISQPSIREKSDSIIKYIENNKVEDTVYINRLYDAAYIIYSGNPDKAIEYCEMGIKKADRISYKRGLANCNQLIGVCYRLKSDYPKSLDYLFKALEFFEELGDKSKISTNSSSIGNVYYAQQNYPKAKEYYLKALKISEELNDLRNKAMALGNIGMIHFKMNEYDISLKYYQEVLKIAEETGNERLYYTNLANIANIYGIRKEFEKALDSYMESIRLAEKYGDKSVLAYNYCNIGEIYYNRALDTLKGASKSSEAKKRELLSKALKYYESSDVLFRELGSNKELSNNYMNLGSIYKELGDFKNAFDYLSRAFWLRDSIFTFENQKKLQELEDKRGKELKEKEIYLLQQQKANQQAYIILLAVFILALVSVSIILYRMNRFKKKANLNLTEKNKNIEELNMELNFINEQLMQREQNLRELNNVKDKFFSIIAHDLKNPIGTYKNITEMIYENLDEFSSGELKEMLFEIKSSSKIVYDMLQNLLIWVRSQSGKIEFEPYHCDISKIADNVINILQPAASAKNISLKSEIPDNFTMICDGNMIYTVMQNLVSNAVKFTKKHGNVILTAGRNENEAFICVRDNGVGMESEQLEKLFRIDVNVTSPGTENEKGTGLGLILCKEFIDKHNGRIWAESKDGSGSIFSFSIPQNMEIFETASLQDVNNDRKG